MVICVFLVSCPTNNLLDPPADCRAGQGAPTSHSVHYGEEAQRRPARQDAAQRANYWWDRTLWMCCRLCRVEKRIGQGELVHIARQLRVHDESHRHIPRLSRGEFLRAEAETLGLVEILGGAGR